MTTLLWPGNEFRISHQEMIKGMRHGGTGTAMSYLDTLVIPIIENTPDEEDLREGLEEVRLLLLGRARLERLAASCEPLFLSFLSLTVLLLARRLCASTLTPCVVALRQLVVLLPQLTRPPRPSSLLPAARCARPPTRHLLVGP